MDRLSDDPHAWYCPGCRNYLGRRGQDNELVMGSGALIRANFRCLSCGRLVYWNRCNAHLTVEENGSRTAVPASAAATW